MLVTCPSVGKAITLYRDRVHYFNLGIIGKVPVHGFFQIEEDSGFGFGKGIALNTATFGSSKLYMDVIVFQ